MFYQALCSLALFALLVAYRQARRLPEGGWPFFALYSCAVLYVLAGTYPTDTIYIHLAQSIEVLCFALLLPLYFWNARYFTNLSLPQWRAIRAFALGVPLLLGIDGAVTALTASNYDFHGFHSHVWVAYCFGLLSACTCLWRFTSTPRQRSATLSMLLVPIAIVIADLGYRMAHWNLWEHSPAVWVALTSLGALSLFARRLRSFSIRPVARSSVVDQVRDALFVVNAEQRIVDYNQAAADFLSASPNALIGADATACLPEQLTSALTHQGAHNIILPWQIHDAQYWFEVHINPLIVNQRANGQLLTMRDITRRYRAELALKESEQELQAANAKLEELANTDALTKLYNRRYFFNRLRAEMERHSRSGMNLGVLMLDLDHFKSVNDRHGHPVGDRVLAKAAQCMRDTVREGDSVGRLGGEEFAVLVVDATREGPMILAERLCERIRELEIFTDEGDRVDISTSIGCVQFSGGLVNAETLIKLADQALYQAKQAGRDQVKFAQYAPLPRTDAASRVQPAEQRSRV